MELGVKLLIGFALLCGIASAAEKARFDNYRVYRVHVDTPEQLDIMNELEAISDSYIFLSAPQLNIAFEIVVPPHKLADIDQIFTQNKFKHSLELSNVQTLIDGEDVFRSKSTRFGWNAYYDLDEIYNWTDEQLVAYPRILTNLTVGYSYQGRAIRAVRLSHKSNNPTIIVESTIHAREWITVSTATYLLNELLTSNDTEIQDLARNFNWVIIPVVNVDGYVYTHRYNRLWRKTRRPVSRLCYGADPNRNFDFHFGESGTSQNPCSDTFPGHTAFSEVESRALADFARRIDHKMYISLHSFGQYVMYPYGAITSPGWNDKHLEQIAKKTVDAIKVRYNTDYVYGRIANAIYKASGSSLDWIFVNLNTSLSFVFELRGHRDGSQGEYLLPADQIIPNCLEFVDGLKAMFKESRLLKYF